MPILQITTTQMGQEGVNPKIIYIDTNDTLATVLTAGYLNNVANEQHIPLSQKDLALVTTKPSAGSATTNTAWLSVSYTVSTGAWSLVPASNPGDVTLPTIANHIATFTNALGMISEDPATAISGGNIQAGLSGTAGYLSSFPATAAKGSLRLVAVANTGDTLVTLSNALHGQASVYSIPDSGASTANLILSKTTGTQHITVGSLAVDAGTLISGISTGGTAGGLTLYPATASNGSLVLAPVGNAGNFAATISNISTLGQATVYTLPDVGAATGQFLAKTAALVSGNLIKASGTAGLVVDAGFAVLAKTTASYGGGGTSNAFTATGLATTSIVTASILTSTNSVSITKVVPTANTLTITFSADPGAATTVSYIAISPAV